MELRALLSPAADTAVEVIARVGDDRLDGPTPCTEYDVRTLIGHLDLWTGERAEAAARKKPLPDTEEGDITVEPGWRERYAERARRTAAAWSDPAAWEGETGITGQGTMPAPFIGGIVFGEFLLHGWDLSVATGRPRDFDGPLAQALFEHLTRTADMARRYKVFGPRVPVPESAPAFDRALGLAGRDPSWHP